jgi:adenylate kinase family enzyme
MKKIAITGNCGAGKSHFAKRLSKILKIDVIHLDKYYWKPNWQKTEKEEWQALHQNLLNLDEWIIDGNYKSTLDQRLEAADTVIFLNFSKPLCLFRAIKRRYFPDTDRTQDLGGNNKERLTWNFIYWILTYPKKEMLDKCLKLKDKKVLIINNQKEIDTLLADLKK